MRVVGVLRSSDKTQRGERADDEYSYPKPERPRRRGIPVRLDGGVSVASSRRRTLGAGNGGCVWPITATEKTHALARARTTPFLRAKLAGFLGT